MNKETIYGLDIKGNLKVLSVWAEGNFCIQEYGRFGGKLVRKEKQCHAKNTGRANATTAEEQAQLACERILTKKTEQEFYYRGPEKLNNSNIESIIEWEDAMKNYLQEKLERENDAPMLAYSIEGKENKINVHNGFLLSPKLDGIRCIAVFRDGKLTLKSRKNKPIETMKHIEDILFEPMKTIAEIEGGVFRLDGELYNHSYRNNFEDLVSAIKKYRKGISELVQFHVYDIIDPKRTAHERAQGYANFISKLKGQNTIIAVPQTLVYDTYKIKEHHEIAIKTGYEGLMIKNAQSVYKQSRSMDLLKVKKFFDAEYEITDIVSMNADPSQGLYVCYCPKTDKTFKVTPKTTIEGKREILKQKDQYIGQLLTVKYFELTSDGIPRFPVGLNVRDATLQG